MSRLLTPAQLSHLVELIGVRADALFDSFGLQRAPQGIRYWTEQTDNDESVCVRFVLRRKGGE